MHLNLLQTQFVMSLDLKTKQYCINIYIFLKGILTFKKVQCILLLLLTLWQTFVYNFIVEIFNVFYLAGFIFLRKQIFAKHATFFAEHNVYVHVNE